MQIVLLAAGRGLRLKDKTATTPKTLLPVGGQPILSSILKGFSRFPDNRTLIVGGFEFSRLTDYLASGPYPAELIRNADYEKGNIVSLFCAENGIDDDFCLMNSDHVYPRPILEAVFQPVNRITAVCDFDRPLTDDDMKIVRHSDGTLKQMSKILKPYDGGYIGITLVPKEKAPLYWSAARRVRQTSGDGASVEQVLNLLVEQGEAVDILDASGHVWFEVDTEEDLQRAEDLITKMNF